jgi:peptide/nickel transport system substrate-binding protein
MSGTRFTLPLLRSTTALLLLLLLALAGVSCGRGDDEPQVAAEPSRGGSIVLGSISDVDSWNEYRSHQWFAVNLLRRMFLRLALEPGTPDAGPNAFTPVLAESWTFAEDGLSLTFRLREATWSDGRPITAEDVRFTWMAQTSEDVAWVGAEGKEHITDVEVIDPRTATFHFDLGYPYQLADAVDGGIIPKHVFGEIPFDQWASHDWSQVSIASGPFMLESHRAGVETVLVRNPRYYAEGFPLADRIVVRYVPDIGNLLTQVLSGDIDYVENVPPRDASRLAQNPDVTLIPFDYPSYDYLGWNGNRPPFGDAELRRALALAIDCEALVEDLLYGFGLVSNGPLPSSWWGAARDIAPLPYDPDEARRILAEKGYDGSTAEKTLEVEMLTNSGNRLREDMLVKIQEQLSKVGVRVQVRPMEMRAMREKVTGGDYDVYLGGWVFSGRVDLSVFFQSGAPYNVVGYSSEEVDRLFAELDGCSDWDTMAPLLRQVQQRIHEDQPYTFLYEPRRIAAHGPRIAGVKIDIPSASLARLERFWVR